MISAYQPTPAKARTHRFLEEVRAGLALPQKSLPSKYFYDAHGDQLYNKIMATQEYYPARCEMEIFSERTADLVRVINGRYDSFALVELGPGDVRKSIYLISALYVERVRFTYVPIDISPATIAFLSKSLPNSLPGMPIHPMNGEYLEMLTAYNSASPRMAKVMLILGGNIANMLPAETRELCRQLRASMSPGDLAIIGFDLRKNPHLIRAAYNDQLGFTAAFNLNLLTRMNRELDANFDLGKFDHYCHYDPESGACKSYLVALESMDVTIGGEKVHFDKDECTWTEISQKYSTSEISQLAAQTGFEVLENVFDSKTWFTDSIWIAK
ncbi:MAG TPA: L-histidine N(alpha)-methyltransferase [Puia sp.]|nr:L-histidine N(alpha)-methyltransferase [Puia sp.]